MFRSIMVFKDIQTLVVTVAAATLVFAISTTPASANLFDPCGKYKQGSKKWKKCKGYSYKPSTFSTDDERFLAGYWLAKNARYEEALVVLSTVENKNDPRVWNYIGFATRKLGRVSEALDYYGKAIALKPDYVMARAYMGEAYLAQGDLVAARNQLDEIAKSCGTTCTAYESLKAKVAAYKA